MAIRTLVGAFLSAWLTYGCDARDIAAPGQVLSPLEVGHTTFGLANAPSLLPHILRFEGRTIAGWVDPRRNAAVIIGAPLDPAQSRICGGTVRNQFMPMQLVGDLDEVVKQLTQSHDARILVYDEISPSLEEALCETVPAGSGTGVYLRSDNDLFGTGGNRANAFSEHVSGQLVMTGGGSGHVSGTLHGIGRDGALIFIETSVVITRAR